MMRASQQVMDQLAAKTGLKIKPFVANDYNGVIEAMRSGKIDVAYFGPFSYVLASQLANAEAFAISRGQEVGKSSYNSIIISKKDKGLGTVPQLQGKTFAFVDPSSASGHLFPAGLKGEGIDTDKYFSRVIFSGSHDASIMAVANGKVDAAAVADPIFQTAVAKGHVKAEDFQVIWRSRTSPSRPWPGAEIWTKPPRRKWLRHWARSRAYPGATVASSTVAPTSDQAWRGAPDCQGAESGPREDEMISIRNLRKSYGSNHVLNGIDMDVKAGEFVVMLGLSGTGKSTL